MKHTLHKSRKKATTCGLNLEEIYRDAQLEAELAQLAEDDRNAGGVPGPSK